ncbi:MAG: TMEM165/GDT1 family protein [Bdellovibrionaceae bacterium]|nr:TMEM165/GDT1 family protein [Pseudobdellovibrionaceae bacterium]
MEALINSFLLVFAGEMGDKTQLLALILVARYKKPWTILSAVFIATLLNHALASWVGDWLSNQSSPEALRWGLALTFFVFGIWILFPDKSEDIKSDGRRGAFLTTLIAFFLAEMGDKTQLATVALGARYSAPVIVTIGTTLGMLASNALAVFLGNALLKRIPMTWVRLVACGLFMGFGLWLLLA